MEKTGQERGFFNTQREKYNLIGKALERSSKFRQMMENLRSTDEEIRSQATGIRDIAKWARKQANRKEYLNAGTNFTVIHERCKNIVAELQRLKLEFAKFKGEINAEQYDLLLEHFGDENKERLFQYDPAKKIELEMRALFDNTSIVKNAGVLDMFKAFEKRFPASFMKQLRDDTFKMSEKTDSFIEYMLSAFKRLATARATRDLIGYIEKANDIAKEFDVYDKFYVKYKAKNIDPLKTHYEQKIKEREEATRAAEEAKAKRLEEANTKRQAPNPVSVDLEYSTPSSSDIHNEPSPSENAAALEKLQQAYPSKAEIKLPEVAEQAAIPEEENEEQEMPVPFQGLPLGKVHSQFVAKLEKFAVLNDIPGTVDAILKYAAIIEDKNANDALKLIAIAEGFIDEYKIAGVFDMKKPLKSKPEVNDPLAVKPPERFEPVDPKIPIGKVDKYYSALPFLRRITPDKIRITQGTESHIVNIVMKKLFDYKYIDDLSNISSLGPKILTEMKNAIPRGYVTQSVSVNDPNNPRDLQIEVYTYIDMSKIYTRFKGIAKLRVICRISVFTGTLSIKTIQKNFTIDHAG